MKKYVIFDFNGTLLNDVDLCLILLNEFLTEQKKEAITLERYKQIFGFPIKNYYLKAGMTFEHTSFEEYAVIYQEKYSKRIKEAKLFESVIETLNLLKDKGIKLVVLSATEEHNLKEQMALFNIDKYFDYILGTKNLEGTSKVMVGYNFIKTNHINPRDVVLIGDTTHDYEVSKKMGVDCLLYTLGHQDRSILNKTGAPLISSLKEVVDFLD